MEESVRMTEDRDKWRKYVHGVANSRIKDRKDRTELKALTYLAKLKTCMLYKSFRPWTNFSPSYDCLLGLLGSTVFAVTIQLFSVTFVSVLLQCDRLCGLNSNVSSFK